MAALAINRSILPESRRQERDRVIVAIIHLTYPPREMERNEKERERGVIIKNTRGHVSFTQRLCGKVV